MMVQCAGWIVDSVDEYWQRCGGRQSLDIGRIWVYLHASLSASLCFSWQTLRESIRGSIQIAETQISSDFLLDVISDRWILVVYECICMLPYLQVYVFLGKRWRESIRCSIQIAETQISSDFLLKGIAWGEIHSFLLKRFACYVNWLFSSLKSICISPTSDPQQILHNLLEFNCASLKESRLPLARPDFRALTGYSEFPHFEILCLVHWKSCPVGRSLLRCDGFMKLHFD